MRSRSRNPCWSTRRTFLEGEVVVHAVVRVPPLLTVDGESEAHDELAILNLAFEVFQFDGETEAVPPFVASCTRRDMADVRSRDFRASPACQCESRTEASDSLPMIEGESNGYPFLKRDVSDNHGSSQAQRPRPVDKFNPLQQNVLPF